VNDIGNPAEKNATQPATEDRNPLALSMGMNIQIPRRLGSRNAPR
jgi:hypothetical protein